MLKPGLFSALGGVSVVESYKWLLPDSGDEAVGLLVQISQQLANSSQLPAGSIEPFKRTVPDILTNIFWFISVAICIGCAILATLIQQWARGYLALEQGVNTPNERARVRNGPRKFWMPQVCLLLSMALHVSIALYSLGFIFFVFHVDKAWVPLVALIYPPVYIAYLILTILPIIFWDCPYGTPFTPIVWCGWHFGLFLTFSIISGVANLLCLSSRSRFKLKTFLQDRAKRHRQWASDGVKGKVDRYAAEVPQAVGDGKV